jgi:hypothetical protein
MRTAVGCYASNGKIIFPGAKFDEAIKSRKPDVFEDSAEFKARKSQRREACLCTPQRLRDAAQRRNWPS